MILDPYRTIAENIESFMKFCHFRLVKFTLSGRKPKTLQLNTQTSTGTKLAIEIMSEGIHKVPMEKNWG